MIINYKQLKLDPWTLQLFFNPLMYLYVMAAFCLLSPLHTQQVLAVSYSWHPPSVAETRDNHLPI